MFRITSVDDVSSSKKKMESSQLCDAACSSHSLTPVVRVFTFSPQKVQLSVVERQLSAQSD